MGRNASKILTPIRLVIIALVALGAFAAGWALGNRGGQDRPPPQPDSRQPSSRPEDVELRLDAGGVRLFDGGLELKPMPSFDPDPVDRPEGSR